MLVFCLKASLWICFFLGKDIRDLVWRLFYDMLSIKTIFYAGSMVLLGIMVMKMYVVYLLICHTCGFYSKPAFI
jgi:hypothetical protein